MPPPDPSGHQAPERLGEVRRRRRARRASSSATSIT
jgi:hypothetical protein